MTANTLIQNFDLIAEAPGGVPKLRELILQLAVRGRLVPQRAAEGQTHCEEHKGEKIEGPYAVPVGWGWIALGNAVDYNYGEKADSQDIPADAWLLDLEDIEKDTSRVIRRVYAGERQSTSTKSRFVAGDVLYGKLRPYLNKVLVADSDGYCTTEIVPMRPNNGVDAAFVVCVLKSRDFLSYTAARAYGMKMPRLGTEDAKRAPFPLPPLPEQRRIVARVNELMKRCDELEAWQSERNDRHTVLVSSCLHALATKPETSSFHLQPSTFHLLLTSPKSVAELRKTILQLAVQGSLVPQDQAAHPQVTMRAVATRIHYGYTASANWSITKVRLLRITDIQDNKVNWESVPGCEISDKDVPKYELHTGDILIARTGGTIGKTYLITEMPVRAVFASYLIRVIPAQSVLPQYLKLFLESPDYWEQLSVKSAGTGQPNVNGQALGSLEFDLPPLAEQKRIVDKVNDLMAMCDTMEAKLAQSRAAADMLAAAVVHHVWNGDARLKEAAL